MDYDGVEYMIVHSKFLLREAEVFSLKKHRKSLHDIHNQQQYDHIEFHFGMWYGNSHMFHLSLMRNLS